MSDFNIVQYLINLLRLSNDISSESIDDSLENIDNSIENYFADERNNFVIESGNIDLSFTDEKILFDLSDLEINFNSEKYQDDFISIEKQKLNLNINSGSLIFSGNKKEVSEGKYEKLNFNILGETYYEEYNSKDELYDNNLDNFEINLSINGQFLITNDGVNIDPISLAMDLNLDNTNFEILYEEEERPNLMKFLKVKRDDISIINLLYDEPDDKIILEVFEDFFKESNDLRNLIKNEKLTYYGNNEDSLLFNLNQEGNYFNPNINIFSNDVSESIDLNKFLANIFGYKLFNFKLFEDFDEPTPSITGPSGNAGDETSRASVDENITFVGAFVADEAVSWFIDSGEDKNLFEINESTGALSFVVAPDFENPTDSDANNTYIVSVSATNEAGNASSQTLTVTITDDIAIANNLFIRGKSIYTIVEGPSWAEAEANANKLGGHLVTINDQEEDDFLTKTINQHITSAINYKDIYIRGGEDSDSYLPGYIEDYTSKFTIGEPYWIGLRSIVNRELVEDDYPVMPPFVEPKGIGWSDGSISEYRGEISKANSFHWNPATDDVNPPVDFFYMKIRSEKEDNGNWAHTWPGGGSSSVYYPYQANLGLSETPFIRRGDSAYVIVEGPTWEEAEANANKLGGHLVTINYEEEENFLINNFKNLIDIDSNDEAFNESVGSVRVWTGLKISSGWNKELDGLDSGSRLWSSGEISEYKPKKSFSGGTQINNGPTADSYIQFLLKDHLISLDNNSENKINNESGTWISFRNSDDERYYDGSIQGIAEIKLAPNNAPTGTVSTTGDAKVGETITIDISDIKDEDNFEGYTPTFNYSWETSSDNGETWTGLTSADAKDNNSSYLITYGEDGKNIRGVISYVDGFGSNEKITKELNKKISNLNLSEILSNGVPASTDTVGITLTFHKHNNKEYVGYKDSSYDFSTHTPEVKRFLIKDEYETSLGLLENKYNDEYHRYGYAIEEVNDDIKYNLLLIKEDYFFENLQFSSWKTVIVNIDGVIDWSTNVSYNNVIHIESLFNQDLNYDGQLGGFFEYGPVIEFPHNPFIDENQSYVGTLSSNETVTWSISGGVDENNFSIDAFNGDLTFKKAPDFENPTDSDLNNTYEIIIEATDVFGNSSSLINNISIQKFSTKDDDITSPVITGPSGNQGIPLDKISIKEGNTNVFSYSADEYVSWSIDQYGNFYGEGEGSTDASKFSIDQSGSLSFNSAPDFEKPTDSDAYDKNTYLVLVIATDKSGNSNGQSLIVTITDVAEGPAVKEPYQSIFTENKEINYTPGQDVSFDIFYTTSDNQNALTGLGLKVHYDSSVFTPSGENNGVSALVNTFGDPNIIDDTENLDNDSATDKYITITWTDFMGNFPGGNLPATLASLSFSSSETGVDTLTGENKESKINFTSSAPAQNYDFLSQSVTLKPNSFTLDVDGDGSVTALGDGLMVIRKLFGTAFAGDALTSKAMSNDATRSTTEIHQFIQTGIDEKVLDVDGDGQVTALGDGLMVIRKLFGTAFEGEALTSKAISNDATRTTDEIHEYIAAMSTVDTIA